MATITYELAPALDDDALNALFAAAWPAHARTAFGPVLAHSLTYVAAFDHARLVGFVRLAWDGGGHAFVLDPTVEPSYQRRGIGTALIRRGAEAAQRRGVEWLHVDYEPALAPFYHGCGFRPTAAGVRRLRPPSA